MKPYEIMTFSLLGIGGGAIVGSMYGPQAMNMALVTIGAGIALAAIPELKKYVDAKSC